MPGVPQRVQEIMQQLDALSSIKPKDEQEAQGLAQARQQLMNDLQQTSEGMGQMDPHGLQGDGFTGRIDGKVFDAPWRGEYDMPGNFERNQRMANSLAEDAYLGAGLGSKYDYDPSQPIEGKIISSSPAMAANAPWLMNNTTAYFDGPPEVSKYGMPGDTERNNRGKMLTEDQLKHIAEMLGSGIRGGERGRARADRMYGENTVYQKLTGRGV